MSDLDYRWMQPHDAKALSQLAHRIWHAHYPSIITRDQIDYMLAKSYTPENLARQLNDGHEFLLALKNGAMVGFVSTGNLSSIENPVLRGARPGHFLHKFYIAPELHGQGIGKSLFRQMLKLRPSIRYMRLQVARANVNSWNFYQKLGFTIEREHDFPIGENYVMKDYVMAWSAQ